MKHIGRLLKQDNVDGVCGSVVIVYRIFVFNGKETIHHSSFFTDSKFPIVVSYLLVYTLPLESFIFNPLNASFFPQCDQKHVTFTTNFMIKIKNMVKIVNTRTKMRLPLCDNLISGKGLTSKG